MSSEGRSPRVLVVEDDEDIALALQRSLRLEGYDVRISRDGAVALEDVRQFLMAYCACLLAVVTFII